MEHEYATGAEFADALNKERLSGNSKWIFWSGMVAGKLVEVKTYIHSYLQIYRIDGISQRLSPMDCNVGTWRKAIIAPFEVKG